MTTVGHMGGEPQPRSQGTLEDTGNEVEKQKNPDAIDDVVKRQVGC